jgi:hypothetical protein
MGEALESADPALREAWGATDRDYAILRSLIGGPGEPGLARGAERLSQIGGMGGAVGQALENTGQGLLGGVPVLGGMAQRAVAQESRMVMPGIQQRVLERLVAGSPALQRAAQVLQQAMARGPNAGAAAHYLLSQQNPEYRQAAEAAQEEETQ